MKILILRCLGMKAKSSVVWFEVDMSAFWMLVFVVTTAATSFLHFLLQGKIGARCRVARSPPHGWGVQLYIVATILGPPHQSNCT